MSEKTNGHRPLGVGDFVEAFESAQARDGKALIGDFAPPQSHPDRAAILCELVRVDLEHHWDAGRPRRLEEYRVAFPELFHDPKLVRDMAYEEYRLRLQAGEDATPDEYRHRFGVDGKGWPLAERKSTHDEASASEGMRRAASAYRAYRVREEGCVGDLDVLFNSHRVSREHADFLRDLDRVDPHAAERLSEAMTGFPRVGDHFLDFRLCEELGRGAFGRVYLARQGDLVGRRVALKVSADVTSETNALAQLQHTNVVPIFSIHRRGPLQAVCMPYLGATTLADTIAELSSQAEMPRSGEGLLSTLIDRNRDAKATGESRPPVATMTEGRRTVNDTDAKPDQGPPSTPRVSTPQIESLRAMGYVPAVLWIIARVADGLAHAHERGIFHRDLKPANILFADDGEPLLLDFNLSADKKMRLPASAALVGGTLPYMAPEQLNAFREGGPPIDARGDIYSLGIILYEMLTGRLPYPVRRGPVDDILPEMIADRHGPIPDVRLANPSASPAVASIVRHCLEPDPDRRYQDVRELQEDLRRQLADLPLLHAPETSIRERLAKWGRRHPRLTSSTTVAVVAAVMLLAVGSGSLANRRHYRGIEAVESLRRLGEERREVVALLADPAADSELIREGINLCRQSIGRYRVLDDPSWLTLPLVQALSPADQIQLRQGLGDILVLWAQAVASRAGSPQTLGHGAALAEATSYLDRAEACFGANAVPRTLWLVRAELAGRTGTSEAEVRRLVDRAHAIPLRNLRERLMDSVSRSRPADGQELRAFLDTVESREDHDLDYANWLILASWNARLGRVQEAGRCYGVAIALAPQLSWPRHDRGLLALEMQDFPRALEDFNRVVSLKPTWTSAYLNRALAKLGMGDGSGAAEDLTRCLEQPDAPTRAWFIRAKAREQQGDRDGARRDREEGLRRPPGDEASFVARGLERLRDDPAGAIKDFNSALSLNPHYFHALQSKASVLSETLGQAEEAIKVLDTALQHHPDTAATLAGRAVLNARLGRRSPALRDARAALVADDRPLFLYQAACVFALTSKQEPSDRTEAFRLLVESVRKDESWLAIARTDPDMAPLQDRAEFHKIVEALSTFHRFRATK